MYANDGAFLPPDHWNQCYLESPSLYQELAECEYFVGNFQHADYANNPEQ
jgi:hypothetical protein